MAAKTVNINEQDVQIILKDEKFKFIKNFRIKPLSDKVLGLWGDHFILQVETDQKSYEFFLKAIPRHNEKRLEFINETEFFKRESLIYKEFIPKISNLLSLKWAVECLMVKDDHFIVLKNLKGFKLFEASSMILNLEHYLLATRYIASMHASFVIYEEKIGKLSLDQIEKLKELSYPKDPKTIRAISFNNGVKALTKLIQLIPKYKTSPELPKIQEVFPKICQKHPEFVEPSKTFRNILCHGDLWINNLMFRYENEKPIECKIIDFQLARFSPPAMDLATFIYSSSTKDFRNFHLNEILNLYYNTFEEELKAQNVSLKVFSRQQLKESFKIYKIAGLIEATLFAHLILPPNLASNVMESSDEYGKFLSESREDICIKAFEVDSYRERVTELLTELTDEFVLKSV